MHIVCKLFLCCLLSFAGHAQAQDKDIVTLFGTAIPGVFDAKEPGPYNIVYDRLIEGVTAEVVLTMLPIRRATQVFSARGVDCLFLGSPSPKFYLDYGMQVDDIIYSDTIKKVFLKIYGPIGKSPYEDSSILYTANFGIDVGVGEVKNLDGLIPVHREGVLFARTLMDGFRLLDQGRIEALIAIDMDVQALQQKHPRYREYSVSEKFVLRQTEDVFVCRKFPRTIRFIADINRRADELKEAGVFDEMFPGKY